jgi:hypothetical protein
MSDGILGNLLGIVKRGAFGGLLQDDSELLNTYLPQSLQQGLSDEDKARFASQTRNIVATGLFSPSVDSTERARQVQTSLLSELAQRQAQQQKAQMDALNASAQDYVNRATQPTITPEMALGAQNIQAGPTNQRAALIGQDNPNRMSNAQANANALRMIAQKLQITNPDVAEKYLGMAIKGAEAQTKIAEANRLEAAASGMGENPFASLSQSGSLHPSVQKLADQYARSFPTLKPDVVDQRYQTLIDMSNKAFEREQGRLDRKSADERAAADRAESLAFRKQMNADRPRQFNYIQKKSIDQAESYQTDATNAQKMMALADEAERYLSAAPTSTVGGLVARGANIVGAQTEGGTALAGLNRISGAMIPLVPRTPGAQSDFESRKIEQSVGALADSSTPPQAKRDAINFIRSQARRAIDVSNQAQSYLQENDYNLTGFKPAVNAGGVPKVTNQSDYNKLPSGAVYTDPNNLMRRKP